MQVQMALTHQFFMRKPSRCDGLSDSDDNEQPHGGRNALSYDNEQPHGGLNDSDDNEPRHGGLSDSDDDQPHGGLNDSDDNEPHDGLNDSDDNDDGALTWFAILMGFYFLPHGGLNDGDDDDDVDESSRVNPRGWVFASPRATPDGPAVTPSSAVLPPQRDFAAPPPSPWSVVDVDFGDGCADHGATDASDVTAACRVITPLGPLDDHSLTPPRVAGRAAVDAPRVVAAPGASPPPRRSDVGRDASGDARRSVRAAAVEESVSARGGARRAVRLLF